MTRSEISDEVWAVLEPLMPSPAERSRPWADHRLAVEGMAWKFTRWAEDGTGAKLLAEVHKRADAAGKIDWVVSIDSTIARVHQHGAT